MLTLGVAIYVLSLAFQVAGAVLLIIRYWGRTKERIIEEYFPGSNIIGRDEDNNVRLEKTKVQKCAQTIYDNRMAFVFIAIGYILSIFGTTNGACQYCLLAVLVMSTIVIILLEKGISIVVSKMLYREDIVLPYSEIEDIADTTITGSEIEAIINGTYEEK